MPESANEVFLVDDLRVDVGQQRVTRAGQELRLPNLSLQMLLALIRSAPNVLSNDQLIEIVWPGLVVSPETVSKRVNLLREALGDSAQEPRYITGVRSRGYRLVASVSRDNRSAPAATMAAPGVVVEPAPTAAVPSDRAPASAVAVPRMAHSVSRRRTYLAGLVFAASVALVLVIMAVRSHRPHDIVAAQGAKARSGTAAVGPDARARTVAVMPFENISADTADAYLAQGLPEMILNRMSQVAGLSVIARSSSFAPATQSLDPGELGRRLNCAYLVDGSVQREASHLRVAVRLVDTVAGTQIWAARFDRDLREIFALEDEIAEQVASVLSSRVGNAQPRPPPGERSDNVEAYLTYLQGRTLLGRMSVAGSGAAVPLFEKAIALDNRFAAAYASLYDAQLQLASLRHDDLAPVRKRYQALIDRALAIDPASGSARFAKAMWEDGSNEAREADFRRAAELDPSNGRGLSAYADFLLNVVSRDDDGKRVLRRALLVDPMSPLAHLNEAWNSLWDVGARSAERGFLDVLEIDPDFVPALHQYGKYRWLLDGKLAEGAQILEHAIAIDPGNPWLRHTAMAIYLDLGDERAAKDVAEGTRQSALAEGLLALHSGDLRAAARAAYGEAGWTFNYCENWLAAEALRDHALETGEVNRAIRFVEEKYLLAADADKHLDVCNYHAAIYLSQLLAAAGQPQRALALRHAAAGWIDANAAKYLGRTHSVRATVLLLNGEREAALVELAESFRSGSYMHWWYTLEQDPLWRPLHGDPRFQAMADDVHRYIEAQRVRLLALRRQGQVPWRGNQDSVL